MGKSVRQALFDEIYYPIPVGLVENKIIERQLEADAEYTLEVSQSKSWKGALADCLYSLIQATSLSESDKSIGSLTDEDKKLILRRANRLYSSIGEDTVDDGLPAVEIMHF